MTTGVEERLTRDQEDIRVIGPPRLVCLPENIPGIRDAYVSDPNSAVRILEKAAISGNGVAAASLGNMYLNKSIECSDYLGKALQWAETGIEQESTYAHWVKGWVLVEKGNIAEGVQCLSYAMQKNFPPAALDLGVLYQMGWGVTRDFEKSRNCYEIAKRLGHASADWSLRNLSVSGDLGQIRAWLSRLFRPISKLRWRLRVLFGPKFSPTTLYYPFPERLRKLS